MANGYARESTPNHDEAIEVDRDDMEELMRDSTQPIYERCSVSWLQFVVIILGI